MRRRSANLRKGVKVQGGIVRVDFYRGHPRWVYWLKLLLNGWSYNMLAGIKRDIVIDDSSGVELYREGPYTQLSMALPWNRVMAEIEDVGLEDFLSRMRIRYPGTGSIRIEQQTQLRSEIGRLGGY